MRKERNLAINHAKVVEEQVISNMTVHQEIRVVEDKRIIMHQPVGIQMIERGCL